MPSDIDDLLARLRHDEDSLRKTIAWENRYGCTEYAKGKPKHDADCLARYIAAVEALRAQASLQAIANDVVVNERTKDGDQTNT